MWGLFGHDSGIGDRLRQSLLFFNVFLYLERVPGASLLRWTLGTVGTIREPGMNAPGAKSRERVTGSEFIKPNEY